MASARDCVWVSRGRLVFAVIDDGDGPCDVVLGMLDRPEYAEEAVKAHNERRERLLREVHQ